MPERMKQMGKIKMLSDSMIGKIAAGEVVERPVSALKELIENSLDAGASAVTAEIRQGGLSYIRVTDNGCGIDESDLRMAFERHATSKISKEPDLFSIQTLGFRGEALASIAAVSHVVMTTRTEKNDTGLKVTNEGGKILKIEDAVCTAGTTVTVTDLFYNTPVRKGFMKKDSVEAAAVRELMDQFILSRPDISFRYICDGKTQMHSPGDGHLDSAVMTVFGVRSLNAMRRVDGHANGILLKGYVGIGENARGNRGQEYFFVNGRMMHSKVLSDALENACRERVMIGKFPVCALHLKIAFEAVDVNVHPNKLEVRFRDEKKVSDAVLSLVIEALREPDAFANPVPMELVRKKKKKKMAEPTEKEIRKGLEINQNAVVAVTPSLPDIDESPAVRSVFRENEMKPFTRPEPAVPYCSAAKDEKEPNEAANIPKGAEADKEKPVTEEKSEQVDTILPEIRKTMRVFGALFNTFILVEYEDQLLMVDQHAVHERLLFDRLMKEQNGKNAGQEMLVPIILNVTAKEQAIVEENKDIYESIGLVVESFGEHDIAVRTVPVILGEAETGSFVREVIAESEKNQTLTLDKKRRDILQTACKHAVKGGEALTDDQLRSILDEMIKTKVTPTCPHGRPLVVSISHREIDKKFKRIQA